MGARTPAMVCAGIHLFFCVVEIGLAFFVVLWPMGLYGCGAGSWDLVLTIFGMISLCMKNKTVILVFIILEIFEVISRIGLTLYWIFLAIYSQTSMGKYKMYADYGKYKSESNFMDLQLGSSGSTYTDVNNAVYGCGGIALISILNVILIIVTLVYCQKMRKELEEEEKRAMGGAPGYPPPAGYQPGYPPPNGYQNGYPPPNGYQPGYPPPPGYQPGYPPPAGYPPPNGYQPVPPTGYPPPSPSGNPPPPPNGYQPVPTSDVPPPPNANQPVPTSDVPPPPNANQPVPTSDVPPPPNANQPVPTSPEPSK